MRGLPFRLGAALYALRLADLCEVIPLAALRPVPGASASVSGLLNLHGRFVPVIDFARHAVGEPAPVDVMTRIVLLQDDAPAAGTSPAAQRPPWVGLIVGTTGDIVDAPAGTIQPNPLPAPDMPFLAGMSLWRGASVQWIDAARLRRALAPQVDALEPTHV